MEFTQERLIGMICAIPALVIGLTVHEFAHAYVGYKLGDDTPRRMGRVTLDPMAHLDAMGTLFFIIASLSGFGLGWAKPVPIVTRNLHNPRRDSMLVAIAGPISNVLQVPIWLLCYYLFLRLAVGLQWDLSGGISPASMIEMALFNGVILNLTLAAFNMIPIPPLDGHWVLQSLGGPSIERFFDSIRPYSFILLFLIISTTPLVRIVLQPVRRIAYVSIVKAQEAAINHSEATISNP